MRPSSDQHLFNFAASQAVLPPEVLAEAAHGIARRDDATLSVLELPFTGPEFGAILAEAEADLRALLEIPSSYRILFLQGGAFAHFMLVPLNLLGNKDVAAYVDTGHWSRRAIAEAARICRVDVVARAEKSTPDISDWEIPPACAYCHITSNESADGVQFQWTPYLEKVPLVADMTGDFLSRPLDVARYGLTYASAQKSLGIAGLTVVIVRDDLLGRARPQTPAPFNYTLQAQGNSKVNTPPVFAVYVAGLMLKWFRRQGGLAAVGERNRRMSARLYEAIDARPLYSCPVRRSDRSMVNVCFRLTDEPLEAEFVEAAERRGLLNLRGHPAVGGIRIRLCNASPQQAVDALVTFMDEFADAHRDHGR